jgi:hypothetical protein
MLTALAPLVTHPFIVFLPFSPPIYPPPSCRAALPPPRRVQTAGAQARQLICFSVSLPAPAKGGGHWSAATHDTLAHLAIRSTLSWGSVGTRSACIKLRLSDPTAHTQRFDACMIGGDRKLGESVNSYLFASLFTILILARGRADGAAVRQSQRPVAYGRRGA